MSVRTPRPSGVTPGAWALGSHCSSRRSHFPGADRGDPPPSCTPAGDVCASAQGCCAPCWGLAQAPPPLPAPRPKARGHGWGRGCSPSPSTGNLGVSGGNAGLGVWERLSQDPGFAGGFGRLKKQSRGRSQPRVLGRTLGAEEGWGGASSLGQSRMQDECGSTPGDSNAGHGQAPELPPGSWPRPGPRAPPRPAQPSGAHASDAGGRRRGQWLRRGLLETPGPGHGLPRASAPHGRTRQAAGARRAAPARASAGPMLRWAD